MTNQTNQTMVYAFEDKTYGGYDYIEVDHVNKKFTTGNSRSHQGHHYASLSVVVKRKMEIRNLQDYLEGMDWEYVETFTTLR